MKFLLFLIRSFLILLVLVGGLTFVAAYYYMEYALPNTKELNNVQLQVPLQIYTADKKLIATFGEKRRIPLPYDQIPKPLINAVLATEDQRYFEHDGVDLPGLARAAVQLALTGKKLQGGSTITMQVARSFYLSRHKTFSRKIREILLAIKIEHQLSKEKILELYLNKDFMGNRAYGVGAAAEIYYGKPLSQLSLDEYAMLAGIPKAPSTLNPLANPTAAMNRRNHVLTRMHDLGYIDTSTYEKAMQTPLNASYHDLKTEVDAPYVAELVRQQLEQKYGEGIYTDGIKVYTTIHSDVQNASNIAVREAVLAYDQRHGYRGPEGNLGVPDISNMDGWQQKLSKIMPVNNLEPAAVVEMTDQTMTVLRANGDLTIIPWTGLSWARKQLNADYLGPMPRNTEQIVKLGDLVRIMRLQNGSYSLVQMPKAEGALVALDPKNGAILGMTGGFSYQTSKFNRGTSALQQPGSSFKPFVYSAAMDKGYTLATVINDAPLVIENPFDHSLWRPQNDTHKFYGPTRLRTAIIESRNVVSIRLLNMIGLSYALNYVQRFGFAPSQLPPGLSLALGTAQVTPLQMATAYAVFANGGMKVVPFIIDSITNSHDDLIYQARPLQACEEGGCPPNVVPAPRVISPQNAFLMTSAMHDVIQKGTAVAAKNLGRADLAGKTGTTQNQMNAWFAGYNPNIVAIVWMGFDQPQSLHEYANKSALPMWILFMQRVLNGVPVHPLPEPTGIVSARINPYTGNRASAIDPNAIYEFFMLPYVPGNDTVSNDDLGVGGTGDIGDTAQDGDIGSAPGNTPSDLPSANDVPSPDAAPPTNDMLPSNDLPADDSNPVPNPDDGY